MRVVIFPTPGYEGYKFYQPVENDWHINNRELALQLKEAELDVAVYPECDVDIKKDIGIYFDHQPIIPLCHRSICVFLEPTVIRPRQYEVIHGLPYTRILTYFSPLCDNKTIFFSPFPVPSYGKSKLEGIRRDKYICAISGFVPHDANHYNHPDALYKAREFIYRSYGKELDLYGHRWDQWEHVGEVNYLGCVSDKVSKMAEYKNAIVFENCILPGFNSEKLYHAMLAGCNINGLYRGNRESVLPYEEVTEKPWARRIVEHVKSLA